MSSESVRSYFEKLNLSERILHFAESVGTVELAAERIGCDANQIVKSLAYNTSEGPVIVVMAGNIRVDNKSLREKFGQGIEMIPADSLEEITGHKLGGVCPFVPNEGVRVFLDKSLGYEGMLYLGAGDNKSIVALTLEELIELTDYAGWSDIGK